MEIEIPDEPYGFTVPTSWLCSSCGEVLETLEACGAHQRWVAAQAAAQKLRALSLKDQELPVVWRTRYGGYSLLPLDRVITRRVEGFVWIAHQLHLVLDRPVPAIAPSGMLSEPSTVVPLACVGHPSPTSTALCFQLGKDHCWLEDEVRDFFRREAGVSNSPD